MREGLIIAVILLLLGLVGHFDYEDQQAQQEHYCETIKAREWPDYWQQCQQPSAAQR